MLTEELRSYFVYCCVPKNSSLAETWNNVVLDLNLIPEEEQYFEDAIIVKMKLSATKKQELDEHPLIDEIFEDFQLQLF